MFLELVENERDLCGELLSEIPDRVRAAAARIDARFIVEHIGGRSFLIETADRQVADTLQAELRPLGQAARALPHGARPMFLVMVNAPACTRTQSVSVPAESHIAWDGYVSRFDMLLYAAYSLGGTATWTGRLVARIVAELAAFDPALVENLRSYTFASTAELSQRLAIFAEERNWVHGREPSWQDGSAACVDGIWRIHAAHPRCDQIEHRIWCAQLAEALPELEMRRREVVTKYGPLLELPDDERRSFIADVRDLEISDVIVQLRHRRDAISAAEMALLKAWRDLRNALAHGDPVSMAHVNDAVLSGMSSSRL